MDVKRIINAAILPTIVLVVIGVITAIVTIALTSLLPLLGSIASIIINLASLGLSCLVLGWAGYTAVKKYQLDLLGAALTGVVAGVVSSIINAVVSLVLSLLGLVPVATSGSAELATTGAFMLLGWFLGLIIGVGISVVLGAVLGAIGGYIAQRR